MCAAQAQPPIYDTKLLTWKQSLYLSQSTTSQCSHHKGLVGDRLVYDLGKERNGKKTTMSKIISSLETILAIFAFFFIFLSIAAIIGMQLYGGQFDFPDGYFRENFDTFPRGLLTMFQVCQLFHPSGVERCLAQNVISCCD